MLGWKDFFCLCCTWLASGGVINGYGPLHSKMQAEAVWMDEKQLQLMQDVAGTALSIASVIVGLLLDHIGIRRTAAIGLCCGAIGNLGMVLGMSIRSPELIIAAYSLLAGGGIGPYLATMAFAKAHKNPAFLISLNSAFFNVAGFNYTLVNLFEVRSFFMVYAIGVAVLAICSWCILPEEKPSELLADDWDYVDSTLEANEMTDPLIPSAQGSDQSTSSSNSNSNGSNSGSSTSSKQTIEKDGDNKLVNHDQSTSRTGTGTGTGTGSGADADADADVEDLDPPRGQDSGSGSGVWQELRSRSIVALALYYSLTLAVGTYIGGLLPYVLTRKGEAQGASKRTYQDLYTNILLPLLTALPSLVINPLAGLFIGRAGFAAAFAVCSLFSMLTAAALLLPSLQSQLATMVCSTARNAFLFSAFFSYLASPGEGEGFSTKHYGTLVAACTAAASVVGFAVVPLVELGSHGDAYLRLVPVLLGVLLVCAAYPLMLWSGSLKQRRKVST